MSAKVVMGLAFFNLVRVLWVDSGYRLSRLIGTVQSGGKAAPDVRVSVVAARKYNRPKPRVPSRSMP